MKATTTRRLLDARNACAEIDGFMAGSSLDHLRQERLLQLGLFKLLEIVGEALNKARRGEPYVESRIPRLRRYVSLRNQIVHDYDKVDLAIIWQVATDGIPELRHDLERLVGNDGHQRDSRHRYDEQEAWQSHQQDRRSRQRQP